MTVMYGIKVNSFYQLVEQLCFVSKIKNTKHYHSQKMNENIKLTFLACYMQKLNVSYRRFVEICAENNMQRMLGLKRIPHFTTIQKYIARTPKDLFETLVQACTKLLNLKDFVAAIDGTGFSTTNPSHYYQKRIDGKKVKNYTKTVFLSDIRTKLILDVETQSDHTNETTHFKPMVKQLIGCLKTMLADKGYDSMSNRKLCWNNNIDVHIPFRQWSKARNEINHKSKEQMYTKMFDKTVYNQRALAETVNSAIKQTLGGFVRARKASNQQKTITIKALAYNIEHIGRTIKINIQLEIQ